MSGRSSERSLRGPRSKRGGQGYIWDDYDGAQWVLALAIGASIQGAAVRIGHTRDGGALALAIYKDGEYGVEYITPAEDLGQAVREIAQAWDIVPAVWDDDAGRWNGSVTR